MANDITRITPKLVIAKSIANITDCPKLLPKLLEGAFMIFCFLKLTEIFIIRNTQLETNILSVKTDGDQ